MLAGSERQQGFFDAAWCAGLLAENSIYALLAEHGDRIVRDKDFAECYSARLGRPSIPPSLLAKVLLLAYRDGLSDRRAMEALRFDLRWKVALDLPIDHPGFHPTSLVKFRARLLLHGKERIVFERSLELATELGLLEGVGRADRRLDADARRGGDPGHGHAGPRRRCASSSTRSARSTRARPASWREASGVRLRPPAPEAGGGLARKPLAKRCWSRSPPTLSAPWRRSSSTPGSRRGDGRRRPSGCWARSSARSSRPPATTRRARRGRATAAGCGRSSPRTTPRCATAARPTRVASPATSCTSRPTPERRW